MDASNCQNCGAAAEPAICSYCRTPRLHALVTGLTRPSDSRVYGWLPLCPELVVRLGDGRGELFSYR